MGSKVVYLPSAFRPHSVSEEAGAFAVVLAIATNATGAVGCTIAAATLNGDIRLAAVAGAVGFSIGAVTLFRSLLRK